MIVQRFQHHKEKPWAPSNEKLIPERSHGQPLWLKLMTLCLISGLGALAGVAAFPDQKTAALAFAALLGVASLFFVLRKPVLLFWGIVLTVPFNDLIGIPAGGVTLRGYNLLAMYGIAWVMWQAWQWKREREFKLWHPGLVTWAPLLLLVGVKFIGAYAIDVMPMGMSKAFAAKYALFAGLLFTSGIMVMLLMQKRERVYAAIKWWIHIANGLLLYAIFQWVISNVSSIEMVHHRHILPFGRPHSVFREPDVLGCYFGSIVVLVLPLLLAKVKWMSRSYLMLTLVTHALMLVMIFVRAAWIGTTVALMIFAIAWLVRGQFHRLQPYLHRIALGVILAIVLMPILVPSVAEKLVGRFSSMAQPSKEGGSEYRMRELGVMVYATIPGNELSGDSTTFALGHGDFSWSYWAPYLLGENYDRSAIENMEKGRVLIHPGFCMTLSIFFDNGLAGLSLYLVFLLVLGVGHFRSTAKCKDDELRCLMWGSYLSIVVTLICFQFSYDPIYPILWVLIGMHLAIRYLPQHIESDCHSDHVAKA